MIKITAATKKLKKSFVLLLAAIICIGTLSACGGTDEPIFSPNVSAVGVWWWHTNLGDEYLEFAAKNNVTEIYYAAHPNRLAAEAPHFISAAGTKGIKVYLLLGDYNWIHDYEDFQVIMTQYLTYQSSADESGKFAGVHLDVEPHQDPAWRDNRAELLQKFIDFCLKASADYGALDFDIPAWLNDDVNYNGSTTELFKAVITEASRVFIMSYRDSAEKMYNFSTVAAQIEFAKSLDKQIFLCAEVNSPDEDGVAISYRNKGKTAMYNELNKLRDLAGYDKLGVSIHHMKSWFELS